MAITDFDLWLNSVDLSDYNDVYALYHSVSGIEDWGAFRTERGRGAQQLLVHSYDCEEPLLLASDKARDAFLKKVEIDYCESMDIESYYGFHYAMEKND